MGVVLKRAKYFITCNNEYFINPNFFKKDIIESNLVLENKSINNNIGSQLQLF